MVDTVTNQTLFNGTRKLVTRHMSRSDGTGESSVVKVDKSTFTGPDGTEPSQFIIESIEYDIAGMEVLITADHTTDLVLARLAGHGKLDFTDFGGLPTTAAGDTGDIMFSTNLHASGDTYDITLRMIKKD